MQICQNPGGEIVKINLLYKKRKRKKTFRVFLFNRLQGQKKENYLGTIRVMQEAARHKDTDSCGFLNRDNEFLVSIACRFRTANKKL